MLHLSDFRGRVVALNFMYITCMSCRIVIDNLKETAPSHGSDLVVIGVDILAVDTEEMLRTLRTSEGITWHLARDTDLLVEKYGIASVPVVVVVDICGAIAWDWRQDEPWNPDEQKAAMSQAISEAMSSVRSPARIADPGSLTQLIILAALAASLLVVLVVVVVLLWRRRRRLEGG